MGKLIIMLYLIFVSLHEIYILKQDNPNFITATNIIICMAIIIFYLKKGK